MHYLIKYHLRILLLCLLAIYSNGTYGYQEPEQSVEPEEKSRSFFALPVITFSPETSLQLGGVGIYLFRFNNSAPGTQLSSIKLPITYTLENQIKARLSYEIFFRGNSHILKGHVQWIRFPLLFYGLGRNAVSSNEEIYTTETFSIDINYFKRVSDQVFLGLRFVRDDSNIIEVEENGILDQQNLVPGNRGGVTSGIGIIGRVDKRDNNFNATTGPFLEYRLTTFQGGLGSDFAFTKLEADLRHYIHISEKHVFAMQFDVQHNWGGPSFETLALLGGDEIMRGHYEGRFRDNATWALQGEYRIPLGRKSWIDERRKIPFWQRWGLVGFAGFGNVSNELSNFAFGNLKKAAGLGVRFLAIPKERVNIRFDVGFGTQKPGFYFNVREAF